MNAQNPDNPTSAFSAKKGDDLIGKVIAEKYTITECLGRGGMGAVYRAEHKLMARSVALKLLHSHLSENEEFLQRFQREAQVACKLDHPNAITLFDFGIEEDTPYLVMQYVKGGTLKGIIEQEGALSLKRTESLVKQVCSALSEAHAQGIVHRDLKPDNFMISKKEDGSETVFVLDFGIAKLQEAAGEDSSASLTKTGIVMGTPRYMAPEQALAKELDARSDIYSLGVILYEMLTGDIPFDSISPMELVLKHLNEAPTPICDLKPELKIPRPVSDVVMKAMEKEPENRYQSVEELLTDFEKAIQSPPSAATPKKSKKTVGMALGGIAVIVLVGLVLFLRPEKPKPLPPIEQLVEEPEIVPDSENTEEVSEAPEEESSEKAEITPKEIENLYKEGEALRKQKNYGQAASKYEEALSHNPEHFMAHLSLGVCLLRLDRQKEAFEHFVTARKISPEYGPTHYNIASYYALTGDAKSAIEKLGDAVAFDSVISTWPARDSDFDRIRDNAEFQEALKKGFRQ